MLLRLLRTAAAKSTDVEKVAEVRKEQLAATRFYALETALRSYEPGSFAVHALEADKHPALKIVQQRLKHSLVEDVHHFALENKGMDVKTFCQQYNDDDTKVSSCLVLYDGKVWACQLSFKEGPLVPNGDSFQVMSWGLYLLPLDF